MTRTLEPNCTTTYGTDNLTYRLNDGTIDGNTATVQITVNPVDDPLVAGDQTVITDEDTPVDFWPYGGDVDNPVAITIADGPDHGTASLDDNGTPGDTNDDFIIYALETNYNGPDSLTYQVSNGFSTATGTVTIDVRPVNDARLVPPIDQTDREGNTLSLQLLTPDDVGSTVTYSATGLPPGLTLDSQTGLITGTLPYTAAQTNDGTYQVTVSTPPPPAATPTARNSPSGSWTPAL